MHAQSYVKQQNYYLYITHEKVTLNIVFREPMHSVIIVIHYNLNYCNQCSLSSSWLNKSLIIPSLCMHVTQQEDYQNHWPFLCIYNAIHSANVEQLDGVHLQHGYRWSSSQSQQTPPSTECSAVWQTVSIIRNVLKIKFKCSHSSIL